MDHGRPHHGGRLRLAPRVEDLERRLTLSAAADPSTAVQMLAASTADSRSVTIQYTVAAAGGVAEPIVFAVYRSALDRFDGSAEPIGSAAIAAPEAATPGRHQLTISLDGGIPPDPEQPYVLVVVNPKSALDSGDPGATASFRTHVIAVVTHGGMQDKSQKNGPAWQRAMAASLRRDGVDKAIAFNWVGESNQPGAAPRMGVALAKKLLAAASRFPASEPVDILFIGHSEGTVVNNAAIRRLESRMPLPPQLESGYIAVTMLDPHAANPDVPGQQYSVASGPIGWVAKAVIDNYQARARDPRVSVPPSADRVEVFYQHTPVSRSQGSNAGIYNLWGQVPLRGGEASYFNLTPAGATHSGKTGVVVWYWRHVIPLLGDGAPQLQARILTGALAAASGHTSDGNRPTYSGTAQPGSTVTLKAGPADNPSVLRAIGRTKADSGGEWSIQSRPLAQGRYRVLAQALAPRNGPGPRLPMVPTAPLGLLVIAARPSGRG